MHSSGQCTATIKRDLIPRYQPLGRRRCHEDLDITNFGMKRVRFNLEIALCSDFADIFEVKSNRFVRRGEIETQWDKELAEHRTFYSNPDFR
jgi:hypothetical protein